MEQAELEQLLEELRAVGAERGSVEAKRASNGLPRSTSDSLSAFANTDGGILLLGVDEAGVFDVVGVNDASAVSRDLQSACAELEPPLRPRISIIDVNGAAVIVAEVPPVPRSERPCHIRSRGPHGGSFIRVGDADQRLTDAEVTEMLAGKARRDESYRPAPAHAALDPVAAADFARRVRALGDRYAGMDDAAILRAWGAIVDGHPTIAGLLALGDTPAAVTSAARVAYRRLPNPAAPAGARYEATHLEGRVGEVLDAALTSLRRDLRTIQVERGGQLFDELDVPLVSLREIVGNALLHRSLTEPQESVYVAIEVSDAAVEVTSPGGLHVTADPALLGLDSISGVRNLTLVRLCEQLETASGARIVENQASGIAAADRACRELGTMPALFIDEPSRFHAVLLRGALDTDEATQLLLERGIDPRPEYVRIVSVAFRLQRAIDETPISGLRRVVLDARLAARALAPSTLEDGAAVLRQLEDAGIIERVHARHGASWQLRRDLVEEAQPEPQPEPEPARGRRDRVEDLVCAIAASEGGELSSSAIQEALGLRSTNSTNRWINRAADRNLIEATTDTLYAPTRAYRLTAAGRALAAQRCG